MYDFFMIHLWWVCALTLEFENFFANLKIFIENEFGSIQRWLGVPERKFGNELWVCECKVIPWRFLLICLSIGCGIDIELGLGPSHLVYNFERQFQAF